MLYCLRFRTGRKPVDAIILIVHQGVKLYISIDKRPLPISRSFIAHDPVLDTLRAIHQGGSCGSRGRPANRANEQGTLVDKARCEVCRDTFGLLYSDALIA